MIQAQFSSRMRWKALPCGYVASTRATVLMLERRPLMARLPPFAPYKSGADVTFKSVATLAPDTMLDTGMLDFCTR
jgi:hypothetical protein